ncbi:hypothetical protein [Acaryochloris sp. IP29b_bin.137]|uniref:hypothetical protein n=1 Tax=Acaryochloris sp. IP29b_bin.137 TaxID=2969217 RepID=UPI00260A6CA0|nr:hypothetical protein [Acaryochloris sp. IP29b_bin.137]
MTANHNPEEDLRRREQELKEREMSVRLRELEAEVYGKSETSHTEAREVEVVTDVPPTKSSFKRTLRKIVNVGKFLAVVVAVVVAVRIAMWLAMALMIGSIAYISYELFLKGDRSSR